MTGVVHELGGKPLAVQGDIYMNHREGTGLSLCCLLTREVRQGLYCIAHEWQVLPAAVREIFSFI